MRWNVAYRQCGKQIDVVFDRTNVLSGVETLATLHEFRPPKIARIYPFEQAKAM
jgi:hypothetical protein